MSGRSLMLLAAAGSLALLLGAFAFQHLGGLAPCRMCLWQRWPHAAAVLVGIIALAVPARPVALLGAAAAATTAGIGVYHTGVERGWWPGPSGCTGSGDGLAGLSGADLLSLDQATPIVLCDEVAWSLFGLSMASWNALASLGLAALWLLAARRLSAA